MVDSILVALEANLDHVFVLRAIADRYEEIDETQQASAYRWLADKRKHPIIKLGGKGYCWKREGASCRRSSHTLPWPIYDYLPSKGSISGFGDVAVAYRLAATAIIDSKWLLESSVYKMCRICHRLVWHVIHSNLCGDCQDR